MSDLNPLKDLENKEEWRELGFAIESKTLPLYAAVDGRHRISILNRRWLEQPSAPPLLVAVYARVLLRGTASEGQLRRFEALLSNLT